MTTKRRTHESAEKSFYKKLLTDDCGHKFEIDWTGDTKDISQFVRRQTGQSQYIVVDTRDQFKLTCKKCVWRNSGWVNKDGTIPQGSLSWVNDHIKTAIAERDLHKGFEEAVLVATVKMRRGNDKQFWVCHATDEDFIEATGSRPRWGNVRNPWNVYELKSNGEWAWWGPHTTKEAAVAYAVRKLENLSYKGYEIDYKDVASSVGVVSPAATVSISVRKLINDYKEVNKSNPILMKEWLERADEAIMTMDLLKTLRDEVASDYLESLVL